MIIKFSNLGAIKETELDLRPLTVIIGPNNTNKTYITHSLYGLWKGMAFSLGKMDPDFRHQGANVATLDVGDAFMKEFIDSLGLKLTEFRDDLGTFFRDPSSSLFSNTGFEMNISPDQVKEALGHMVSNKEALDRMASNNKETPLTFLYENDVLTIRYENSQNLEVARAWLLFDLELNMFPQPLLLPAERDALMITHKLIAYLHHKAVERVRRTSPKTSDAVMTEIRKIVAVALERGETFCPQPIEDFWDFLTDLEVRPDIQIEMDEKNKFQPLASLIENHILDGTKTVLTPTNLGRREIKINLKGNLSIDLCNASSSIKQLAPLLLYLRHRAAENDLLIIDEPEMGLHPESQAKLLEALCILANLGVKVLLTTHSPYFMSHLNNLVSGDTENPDVLKRQASSLYMKDQRAFLSLEQVSAYEMKDNKLCSLKDEDHGIRWDTLSDVSGDIQQKYFEIHEKREAVSHDDKK
ncbi:MAG: ATP-binding protein [Blastocatellia bacterium]|nr:ATP-binding protein [Blastocatellia bacterium]